MGIVKAKWNLILPILLMVVFALTRWPELMPSNFSAAYALAFCAGVFFPPKLAWWLPLSTLLLTDVALNLFYYSKTGSLDLRPMLLASYMLPNYLGYVALIGLGRRFSARSSWLSLLGGGLAGAILFYVITNTASWLIDPAYPKSMAGWIQALTLGRPGWPHTFEFFRNTLLSGGLFTGLFAGAMKLSGADAEEEEAAVEDEDPEPAAEPEESKA